MTEEIYKHLSLDELEKMLANVKGILAAPVKVNDPEDISVGINEQNLEMPLKKVIQEIEAAIAERKNA